MQLTGWCPSLKIGENILQCFLFIMRLCFSHCSLILVFCIYTKLYQAFWQYVWKHLSLLTIFYINAVLTLNWDQLVSHSNCKNIIDFVGSPNLFKHYNLKSAHTKLCKNVCKS